MKIIEKNINDLIPYVNNARTHSEEQVLQIASSIKEFGFNAPILIDGENGVIAGHGRILAAKKLGMTNVPCIELAHLSAAQKKAYILADNRIALNSGWDTGLLTIEVGELAGADFDLSLLGFTDDEMKIFLIDVEELEGGMPKLADGDKGDIEQITFILHKDQAEIIKAALDKSFKLGEFIETGNENKNGNALARICELFLGD